MNCENCEFDNKDEYDFCIECGFELQKKENVPEQEDKSPLEQMQEQHAVVMPSKEWLLWIVAPVLSFLVLIIITLRYPA